MWCVSGLLIYSILDTSTISVRPSRWQTWWRSWLPEIIGYSPASDAIRYIQSYWGEISWSGLFLMLVSSSVMSRIYLLRFVSSILICSLLAMIKKYLNPESENYSQILRSYELVDMRWRNGRVRCCERIIQSNITQNNFTNLLSSSPRICSEYPIGILVPRMTKPQKQKYVLFHHLYLYYFYTLLSHDDGRQAEVDIPMVENIWESSLDPRNPWWGFWYMGWDAVADVSQGGQARVPTLDPCYWNYMDIYSIIL